MKAWMSLGCFVCIAVYFLLLIVYFIMRKMGKQSKKLKWITLGFLLAALICLAVFELLPET